MIPVNNKFILNKTTLSKLEPLLTEFKKPNSQIIKDTIGRPLLLFGKSKWIENIKN